MYSRVSPNKDMEPGCNFFTHRAVRRDRALVQALAT
jgi:hypothetical protein